ncbi:ankyrin repeat domain-containing protein [Wolbachia endosymbiont (group B) of Hofmannophila pseudospretella]|uniref:ankyrin repeat domain-containing protein n=1 Tax=Wolbachia endosymbiont (group B) of Hofmannophila pseudospretella TaxID=3066177 RepID=UPI003341ED97
MGGWNLLGGLMPPTTNHAEEKERRHSRDSGAEEEFEILEQEEIKEHRHSGDSGNCSEVEEGQNTNRAIELEFQLTQSLLSQVKASENNRNANSGKQAQLDLERMDFAINGQTISKEYVRELYYQHNYLILNENYRTFAKQVFTGMFKYAEAEVPNDNILEELITNCNQAGYEFAMYSHIHPIFSQHSLVPTIPKKIISLYCNSAESVNVEYSDTIVIKNSDRLEQYESDSKLEFTLKSQDGKVEYENGKVTLIIPEQLENYKADGKSLLDEINRHFEDEDNRITETLEKNMNEGPKSFSAEDLSITESSPDNSEVTTRAVADPGILGNIVNVFIGAAEIGTGIATELLWPQDQIRVEPRRNEEEFTIIPKNLTFDELTDVINKAKNYGDYADLDKTINNIEESDRFITDLNCGNLKDFCSQQLNLTDHTHNVLLNNSYDETNGYYNYSVKELSLLAIAANDTLVERYAKTHKSILFTQDEGLDRLLIGVGGQRYTKLLLEDLEKNRSTILPWNSICEKLRRALSIRNQECVKAVLDKFKDTEARSRVSDMSEKFLHYAIQQDFIDVAKTIINHKIADINSIDNSGHAPLHWAVARNNLELMGLLIGNGAEIDIQDERHGRTALHWAAYHDKFEIVKLLVNKGADRNIKDRDGKTALDLVGTKSLYLVREENREKSSSESKITKFLEGLDDKTPLHLNIKKDPESKNIDNQRPQRSIVDKEENIMNNKKVSIEETIDNNNYRRGKMPKNIEEKLSNAIFALNYEEVMSLVEKVRKEDDSVDTKQILNKALEDANKTEVGKKDKLSQSKLAKIKIFLEKEFEHVAALSVSGNIAATASSQEIPVVERKESEPDSPSLSSEDDDFSKLESDDSARISSDPPSFDIISETEVPETAAEMPSMVTEEKSDDLNDEKDNQNLTIPTAVDEGISPIPESQCGTAHNEEDFTVPSQSSSLGFANESVNTVISIDNNREKQTSNKPAKCVEQVANENIQLKSVANKQASNSNKIYTKENSVKWPTVATWMFAVTGILALAAAPAAYFALGTSLLVAGVAAGIGAFCIVAAIAVHYYNKAPSGPLKGSDVEEIVRNAAVGAS